MKILALEREIAGIDENLFGPLLKPEARRVWELYTAGIIREMHFRADRHEAVLVMECANAEEALNAINTLPLVQARLITFDLIPLIPYPGFERLFEREVQDNGGSPGDSIADPQDHH